MEFRVRFFLMCLLVFLAGCGREEGPAQEPATSDTSVIADQYGPEDEQPLPDLSKRAGCDWPSFLGMHRDGKSTEKGIRLNWPADGPPIVWQRKLEMSYGIGSVSRGRYYQFDRPGDQAQLICMNAETGKELWRFAYPTDYEDMYGYNGGPRCSPVIDGNRVYIYGAEGMLHCLRASDGKLVWKSDTPQRFGVVQNFFGVGSTPIVEGDLLIAIVGGSSPEDQRIPRGQLDRVRGNGSGVVAFNKYTGEVKYKISDELAGYASPVVATIKGRRWCFAFCRGGLLAFDPAKGTIDFHYPWRDRKLESVNASTPVVVGDEVFISETYGPGSSLLRVKPGGYEIVWRDELRRRQKAMKAHWNTPVYYEGYLYGCSGRNPPDAELRCIQWSTGKVMWSVPTGIRSSMMFADGHLIALGERGTLQLIKPNPQRLEIVAEATLRATGGNSQSLGLSPPSLLRYPCWAAPILSHGLLYVRGTDRLVCLELIPAEHTSHATEQ